jgi:phosphoribosylformylglycinamidine synthase
MPVYRFVVASHGERDPRDAGLLLDARALGFLRLQRIQCQALYFVEGQLTAKECQQLALELLIDPLVQSCEWTRLPAAARQTDDGRVAIEVALRHGVTDPVAAELVRGAGELGLNGLRQASSGMRYLLDGLDVGQACQLAERLLANPVIQRWAVGEVEPAFPEQAQSSGQVEAVRLRGLEDEALLALSNERRAALDLAEMRAIRTYCEREGRDLTDVEFEAIAQTWSEHCVHKTFKGRIVVKPDAGETIVVDSLFKTYIQSATQEIAAPWVLSAFSDNAGILDLDGVNEVSFKVETHNHPSAIEPFGGANTGVGGVIRDVLGVSHKPVANTDVLCFGTQSAGFDELPAGVLHPRRIFSGVVAGVQDYGNKMGIPTVNGAILFDPGYAANPLVFCGTVGISPRGLHPRQPNAGDRVIVLGGRTGRDGLRGATFSSMAMDAQTGEVSGSSVQIGNPIVEKGLVDVILPARDRRLYSAITDCGAGGLSSAVGEMSAGIGCDVDLASVRLKYPGLAPWEIWLSEAQERMVLAVPLQNVPAMQELCDTFDTELTDIGAFTGSGRLVVRYAGRVVLDLENAFLHHGIPQRQLSARIHQPVSSLSASPAVTAPAELLLRLLSHPDIASKEAVIRIYDHEVQGGTVIKPLSGAGMDGPADACVLHPSGAQGLAGIVLANGINPEYGKRDAYRMACAAVDEAVRNAVACGADPARIALLDNFCWGDPRDPDTLGTLVEAARGCRDAALLFHTPFVSGKDSLNNEYLGVDGRRHAIPPTLLISAIGILEDVTRSMTMELKAAGSDLFLVGEFQPVFGGSHFDLVRGAASGEPVPELSPQTPAVYAALHRLIHAGPVRAVHDLSEGGLGVAAAEMCLAGRLGLTLELPGGDPVRSLFAETTGCLLVEVPPQERKAFLASFAGLPALRLGTVEAAPVFSLRSGGIPFLSLTLDDLILAWKAPLQ